MKARRRQGLAKATRRIIKTETNAFGRMFCHSFVAVIDVRARRELEHAVSDWQWQRDTSSLSLAHVNGWQRHVEDQVGARSVSKASSRAEMVMMLMLMMMMMTMMMMMMTMMMMMKIAIVMMKMMMMAMMMMISAPC